jgi:hypothetical protein
MKKMFFLMLTLMVLGVASMNAQVTIGSEGEPHDFSVLELISVGGKGLRMPQLTTIEQTALTNELLALPDEDAKAAAKGLTVYNTNKEELQIWTGSSWVSSANQKPTAPTSITISGGTYVEVGKTLQLTIQTNPENAILNRVVWSQTGTNGAGTISQSGIFTATAPGNVEVSVVAIGTQAKDTHNITIVAAPDSWTCGSSNFIDLEGHSYPTRVVNGRCWMDANLITTVTRDGYPIEDIDDGSVLPGKHGFKYPGLDPSNGTSMGLLYDTNTVNNVCPDGWETPWLYFLESYGHYLADNHIDVPLTGYVVGSYVGQYLQFAFMASQSVNAQGYYSGQRTDNSGNSYNVIGYSSDVHMAVRCMKS